MKIDEETLIEISDYINHLAETVGLNPDTIIDIDRAIEKFRKELKSKKVIRIRITDYPPSDTWCFDCIGQEFEVIEKSNYYLLSQDAKLKNGGRCIPKTHATII